MDVVLIPGICFSRERRAKIIRFVDYLEKETDCSVDVLWFRKDQYKENQGLSSWGSLKLENQDERRFLSELSFDIHYVMSNFKNIQIPKADVYIGHSAGCLLTMLCDKPSITMGNPASVLDMFYKSEEFHFLKSISFASNPILNIVNRKDIAAYPFELPKVPVENFLFSSHKNPFGEKSFRDFHDNYYDNKKVLKLISNRLKG